MTHSTHHTLDLPALKIAVKKILFECHVMCGFAQTMELWRLEKTRIFRQERLDIWGYHDWRNHKSYVEQFISDIMFFTSCCGCVHPIFGEILFWVFWFASRRPCAADGSMDDCCSSYDFFLLKLYLYTITVPIFLLILLLLLLLMSGG